MNKPQPARLVRPRPAPAPLNLEFVLTEVVRILREERGGTLSQPARRLAA